jgi:hypothetical protein
VLCKYISCNASVECNDCTWKDLVSAVMTMQAESKISHGLISIDVLGH